ncbi:type II secretion system F family protein [Tabrizicola sp. J26]|uniref:type II secretion system F family protein n=1 Tax=Alitabrizicola rongguiensis TaxID=2909234 RepID=UPI001F316951|nr:type II secretion system F family protein [Tabrizicola rongguiensis]MCF1710964.1 type II secretion system F family protein [Tabrizicola rongguiensis]
MENGSIFGLDLLLIATTFVGALLAFEGIRQALSRQETPHDARNRRMRMIAKGATGQDVLRLLKPRADTWALSKVPGLASLPLELRQAGISISAGRLSTIAVGSCLLFAGALSRMVPFTFSMPVAILLFVVLPLIGLKIAVARRLDQLTRQLPEALDLMARGLRVGHPLNATMASVAREMSDPVASEFGVMVDQIAYGDDLVDAFRDLADRVGTEDARFLAVSIAIQHGTGGDLARMLATLARVIRDRLIMRRKIKAISAEGRLSALILSLIPLIIIAVTTSLVPSYYGDISDDPLFRPTAILVLGLVIANALVMRQLVNFRF